MGHAGDLRVRRPPGRAPRRDKVRDGDGAVGRQRAARRLPVLELLEMAFLHRLYLPRRVPPRGLQCVLRRDVAAASLGTRRIHGRGSAYDVTHGLGSKHSELSTPVEMHCNYYPETRSWGQRPFIMGSTFTCEEAITVAAATNSTADLSHHQGLADVVQVGSCDDANCICASNLSTTAAPPRSSRRASTCTRAASPGDAQPAVHRQAVRGGGLVDDHGAQLDHLVVGSVSTEYSTCRTRTARSG